MSPGSCGARVTAYWLIALVVFPFSAPLSVCELSDLVERPSTTITITAPLSNTPVRISVVKEALSQTFPVRSGSTRTRRDAPSQHGLALPVIAGQSRFSNRSRSSTSPGLARPITKTILRI